jgi:DNA replication and repair protein RecF
MDDALSQMDAAYLAARSTYDKALSQRNALLRNIAAGRGSRKELPYWDEQLVGAGAVLIAGRQQFLREIEHHAQTIHAALTNRLEVLTLRYVPGLALTADNSGQMSFEALGLDIHRQLSEEQIASQFHDALARSIEQELQRGHTMHGPHRDELRMDINRRDVTDFGSRGQARTTVMALKLAERDWMTARTDEPPLLLLDEVIAELDAHRRAFLLSQLDGRSQTLMTTTEPDIFTDDFLSRATVLHIEAGRIR